MNRHAISARRLGLIGRTAKYIKRNPIAAAFGLFVLMTAVGIGTDWLIKAEKARIDEIAELQGELIEDVFRGVTNKADTLIMSATRLGANDQQIQFMNGLKDVFNQDYEHSIEHFDRVLAIEENHIPSQALRAIATLWHGDEYSYFEQINKIDPTHAQTFEENFFLGYAYTWGDSQLAEELLNAAEKSDPGHQYVRFLRGVARRNIATLVALSADDAKIAIDAAFEDITRLSAGLEPTPPVLKERTWVCIDRAGIYRELATAYPEQADSYLFQAERDMQLAGGYLNELLRDENKIREDTQYAAVTLLIQLGDDDTLKRVTDNWLETPNRPIMVYAAQTLALYFLETHDYQRARDWVKRFSGNVADNSKFVSVFVDLMSKKAAWNDLHRRQFEITNSKLKSRATEYTTFDVLLLYLLGTDQLTSYSEGRLDPLIMDGKLYEPHKRYFSVPADFRWQDPEELLKSCRTGPGPSVALMHANFGLAMVALAEDRQVDAKKYFNDVKKGRQYMMYVHMLSRAILAHSDNWDTWSAKRQEIVEQKRN